MEDAILDPGKLDRRIRIESKSVTQDASYGTAVITWAPFATVWAQVEDVLPSKSEVQANGIRIAEHPAKVRVRYLAGITSDMRVVDIDRGSRLMKILTPPAEIGRKQGLVMMCADYSTQGDAA